MQKEEIGGRYAKYVLVVLVIVYIFNFIDRQILSILAEEIKADLGISDAEIGFLYGTAFAVFYAVFGIPLGRLADTWVRKNLISIGLMFWSLMTALSGTARGFGSLAVYRVGVGIGEASATPAAFSMLSDYFSPQQRDEKRPVVWVRWVGDLRSRVTVGRAVTEPADAHLCRPLPHTPQSSYPCLRPDAQQPWERRGVETEGMRYMDGAILNPPNPIDRHSAKIATLCSPKLRSGVHRLSSD